jgi:pimeloyl-ACP methyl ester carboxylesterase
MTIQRWAPMTAIALATALAGCGGSSNDGDVALPAAQTLQQKCVTLANTTVAGGAAAITAAAIEGVTAATPEYCALKVKMAGSDLRFELRLPTEHWNEKLAFLGGGGFDGSISVATQPYHSPSIGTERYATMATNGGYDRPAGLLDYFKAEFAADPRKLADFTNESEHRALPVGKQLIADFYGRASKRAYFEGCSMGGHDAMIEAQRYPEDFDGIVARAPAGNIMGLFMQFNRIAKNVRPAAGRLNAAKQALLANAVLAQCDSADGLVDGIIGKPAACNFNAQALRCSGGADTGDSCLSDAQLATVNAITTPIAMANGKYAHTGYFYGGEDSAKGWGEYIWPNPALGDSLQGLFSDGFIRSFVTKDPAFNTANFNADNWTAQMDAVGALFSANNPDLSGLRARNGKLILWNGTTDTSVSPKDNAAYYESVVARMGQAQADQVVEYFQAPGVGHCFGGVGPDRVDLLKAMVGWVEQGVAPSSQGLVHQKLDAAGKPTMSRPVCKYPAYPRYRGSGDVNDAGNFACSTQ